MNTTKQPYTAQEKLFIHGVKKTIYLSARGGEIKRIKGLGYPYVTAIGDNLENYLFFQNKKAMNKFMKEYRLKEPFMEINDKVVGKALNFPPLAYETYPAPEKERTIVSYHDIQFTCRKQDLRKCLWHMKENFKIPKELQTEVLVIYRTQEGAPQKEIKINI